MSYSILIVEDEPNMRLGLKDNLEFEGYTVDLAEDGAEGLDKILKKTYDLIIMDVMMPRMSGLDACRKAREGGIEAPILLLTAKSEEVDKVIGLELGADDYVTKPFSLRELLARIKAILRRASLRKEPASKNNETKVGRLTVNFDTYTANDNQVPVRMSHKEYAILQYLLGRKNETVSRYDLLEKVWGYEESPTTRTVDNFIVKLRQKVEADPNDPRIILTVHGTGYKLIF
ncbi:MAG TPA: response regulator transcription factor [Cyclobacteriaceae bacterium]|nr:response regulator transcription factor [Cyclobacteriaceae bacterium]